MRKHRLRASRAERLFKQAMETRTASPEPACRCRAAVVINHDVEDYAAWKRAFDRHAATRRNAGIVAAHVNQDAENPNRLSVYLAGADRAKLAAFVGDIALMATMREAGVTGPPHIIDLTPVEDLTCKDRPLAGLIIRHEVRDYAAWKAAFDGHAEARARPASSATRSAAACETPTWSSSTCRRKRWRRCAPSRPRPI